MQKLLVDSINRTAAIRILVQLVAAVFLVILLLILVGHCIV